MHAVFTGEKGHLIHSHNHWQTPKVQVKQDTHAYIMQVHTILYPYLFIFASSSAAKRYVLAPPFTALKQWSFLLSLAALLIV